MALCACLGLGARAKAIGTLPTSSCDGRPAEPGDTADAAGRSPLLAKLPPKGTAWLSCVQRRAFAPAGDAVSADCVSCTTAPPSRPPGLPKSGGRGCDWITCDTGTFCEPRTTNGRRTAARAGCTAAGHALASSPCREGRSAEGAASRESGGLPGKAATTLRRLLAPRRLVGEVAIAAPASSVSCRIGGHAAGVSAIGYSPIDASDAGLCAPCHGRRRTGEGGGRAAIGLRGTNLAPLARDRAGDTSPCVGNSCDGSSASASIVCPSHLHALPAPVRIPGGGNGRSAEQVAMGCAHLRESARRRGTAGQQGGVRNKR